MSEQVTSVAYHNFINTCRNSTTQKSYKKSLEYFMKFLKVENWDELLEPDPKTIQRNICDYIMFMKSKNLASKSISLYVAAVRKFYDMNDIITLNWKKIHSFEPEPELRSEDRPYTHQEIAALLTKASSRDRAIIQLMASSGMRVGAIPSLQVRDLHPIDKYQIYKITVYRKSTAHYFVFCSPETRKEIDSYISWRQRPGEKIGDDSPLFRKSFDPFEVQKAMAVTYCSLNWNTHHLLKQCGFRPLEPSKEGQIIAKRKEIMQNHGFRKFFETNAFKAGMDHMYLRRLMGQKSGLEDAYLKLSEEELLEGDSKHVGYVGTIDQVTINEENKLRREVQTLKQEVTRFDKMQKQIEELNRRMGLS
jgi:integrase